MHKIKNTNLITCQDSNCRAEHYPTFTDKGVSIELIHTKFKCDKCNSDIPIENRYLQLSTKFKCPSCKAEHQFLERYWGYALVENIPKIKIHKDIV